MAKASPFNATFPEFKAPEFKLPKFDVDALFALQTANLAAAHEVQSIVLEAVQAIAKVQHGWVQENLAGAKAMLSGKEPKQPQAQPEPSVPSNLRTPPYDKPPAVNNSTEVRTLPPMPPVPPSTWPRAATAAPGSRSRC